MGVTLRFAEAVRTARSDLKYSQSELARRSGVSPQMISALENGDTNISLHLALKLAVVLELGLDQIKVLMDEARQEQLL